MLLACALALALSAPGATAAPRRHHRPPSAGTFYVGAAKVDVTPRSLRNFYLGGYGIGPVHQATGVLRHIYFRVIAIRDRRGGQIVIGSIDSQGYSIAYQNGPFGFSDIDAYIQRRTGIPPSHILLQATHSHNAPDEIGVWGGVPTSYMAFVTTAMEQGIERAVAAERPAVLKVSTADMTGFSSTFGRDGTSPGDSRAYPIDNQLRVLQARRAGTHRVIATLVNLSTHPTVYGPLNKISPDWPGATATYLEADERGMRPHSRYGFPGSTAVVTIGAVGHTWPAGVPASDRDPGLDPPKRSDANYPADRFGNAVAQRAIDALSSHRAFVLRRSIAAGDTSEVQVENTNPVLLVAGQEPANSTPLGGYKIQRSFSPPWGYGDVIVSRVTTLRVGDLPVYGVPGEPYPSVKSSLQQDVHAPVQFMLGLANDQLGYVEEPADYDGAFQCSTTDEWFFTISPVFGADVERLSRANASALGLQVGGNPLDAYGPDPSPSTNCTQQQISPQGLAGSPPVG